MFERPCLKLKHREKEESAFSHFSMDINKVSNPTPIYCFFITLLRTYLPGNCFYGFITFLVHRLCVCALFWPTAWPKSCQWRPSHRKWCDVAGGFLLLQWWRIVVYSCCYYLLWFGMSAFVLTFLIVRGIWVIEFIFEWQACINIYTVFRVGFFPQHFQ